jgi:hypothetical protein
MREQDRRRSFGPHARHAGMLYDLIAGEREIVGDLVPSIAVDDPSRPPSSERTFFA